MNFDKLKKVPPIKNRAPKIKPGDMPWSDVFYKAAHLLEQHRESFLCYAISSQRGPTNDQAHRMQAYIYGLMPNPESLIDVAGFRHYYTVTSWLEDVNGMGVVADNDYRAAWARHLAAQFRAKGL